MQDDLLHLCGCQIQLIRPRVTLIVFEIFGQLFGIRVDLNSIIITAAGGFNGINSERIVRIAIDGVIEGISMVNLTGVSSADW